MKGQSYRAIIDKLVVNGNWRFLDTEDGWSRLMKWTNSTTSILELEYDDDEVITGVYKYSY